jgi:hypothetical protein
LYHVAVGLQHERASARRLAIALEPPSSVSRDLSLYRRGLFSALGEATALSFPDLSFLTWDLTAEGSSASLRSPGKLRLALDSCWRDVRGRFASAGIAARGNSVYLRLEGPLEAAVRNAAAASEALGLVRDPEPPLELGLGFFLLKSAHPEEDLARASAVNLPRFSFADCSIALLRLGLGEDPFRAASWSARARSRRRTGP